MEHEADFVDELIASEQAERALSQCLNTQLPYAARSRAAYTLYEYAQHAALERAEDVQAAASTSPSSALQEALQLAAQAIRKANIEQTSNDHGLKAITVDDSMVVHVHEGSVKLGVGAKLWKSAAEVARVIIHTRPDLLRNKRVLELGTGVCLLSIALAQHNTAKELVATDCDERILQLARENIRENAQLLSGKTPIRVSYLDWRACDTANVIEELQPPFVTVVGSELMYSSEHATYVANALATLLAYPHGECVIGQAVRDKGIVQRFASECLPQHGMYLASEMQLCNDPSGEYEGGYTLLTVKWSS